MAIALQSDTRTACVALLEDFAQASGIKLQVYRARPTSLYPPTGFVDRLSDELTDFLAPAIFQHVASAEVVVIHGIFDHGETVDQRDAFVDAFLDWNRTRYHQAGANSLLRVRRLTDDPEYIPTWMPEDRRLTYYATLITVEVEGTD